MRNCADCQKEEHHFQLRDVVSRIVVQKNTPHSEAKIIINNCKEATVEQRDWR